MTTGQTGAQAAAGPDTLQGLTGPRCVRAAALAAAIALGLALAGCQRPDSGGQEAASAASAGKDAGNPAAAAAGELTDDLAKASYSLGYQVADNVDQQFQGGLTSSAFVQGVQDRLASRESLVSAEDSERLRSLLNETREAALASQGLKNLEAGLAFLAENGAREGVVTTESGLQYEVLQTGDGPKPGPRDQVTTHYEGRLIDGTVFDSSYQRGEPATFPLDRVIPGWTEALQLMPQGSKWRLYVPADLAYGERAAGRIPPNSTLVFDVELLNVEPAAGQ